MANAEIYKHVDENGNVIFVNEKIDGAVLIETEPEIKKESEIRKNKMIKPSPEKFTDKKSKIKPCSNLSKDESDTNNEYTRPVFYKLQDLPFPVNLTGKIESVIQVDIMVQLAKESDKEKIEAVQPKILHSVNRILRTKTLDEVKTNVGQEKLAEQIRDKINSIIEVKTKDEGVLSVNFTKYFYQ